MLFGLFFVRATTLVAFIDLCVAQKAEIPKHDKKYSKYPPKVYDIYQNRGEKKPKLIGEWSPWSPWSTCSRTCGGGITQQVRHCVNRPADSRFVKRQRRRRDWKPGNECVGLYKRIHLCNTQDCPEPKDFRYEQCAAFNSRPFKGTKYYEWEPFYQANAECVLNCRPKGHQFYATLNKTVIDGTPCYRPVTSTGKAAPKGTKGVCIDGYCKLANTTWMKIPETENKKIQTPNRQ